MIKFDDSLMHYVDRYCLCRSLSASYAASLRAQVAALVQWAGRPLKLSDLTDDLVSRWIQSLQRLGKYKPKTIREYRASVLAIWRDAYEGRLTDVPPGRVRKVKVPRQPVEAWTLEEIRQLLEVCKGLRGIVAGTPVAKSVWWDRFIRLGYHSGLRLGDLLAVRGPQIDSDGLLRVTAAKTGEVISVRLPGPLVPLRLIQGCILPWPGARRGIFRAFAGIVARAGVRPGTTRWLRRSAASYCESATPGAAKALLGHRTPGLAERHYLDAAICGCVPSVPEL